MNPKDVKRSEPERVWVITEWNAGIVDYETGERDADPIEWECRTMYSEVDHNRDIKALEKEIARLNAKVDEFIADEAREGSWPPEEDYR